jgi:hypothetical protein
VSNLAAPGASVLEAAISDFFCGEQAASSAAQAATAT